VTYMNHKTTALPAMSPTTALRKVSGLSAARLADKLGCSRANVFQTERRGGGVSVSTLWEWAEAMGYEIEIVAYAKRDG
jgi:transcriptional regulator with XRE-family HTH domain